MGRHPDGQRSRIGKPPFTAKVPKKTTEKLSFNALDGRNSRNGHRAIHCSSAFEDNRITPDYLNNR
jgi:hypothetical protein